MSRLNMTASEVRVTEKLDKYFRRKHINRQTGNDKPDYICRVWWKLIGVEIIEFKPILKNLYSRQYYENRFNKFISNLNLKYPASNRDFFVVLEVHEQELLQKDLALDSLLFETDYYSALCSGVELKSPNKFKIYSGSRDTYGVNVETMTETSCSVADNLKDWLSKHLTNKNQKQLNYQKTDQICLAIEDNHYDFIDAHADSWKMAVKSYLAEKEILFDKVFLVSNRGVQIIHSRKTFVLKIAYQASMAFFTKIYSFIRKLHKKGE